MSYKSLQDFIKQLEKEGELLRIKEEVDTYLEITEITERVSKASGMALLFENVRDSAYPILTNAMGTPKRMAMALGVKDFKALEEEIEKYLNSTKGMKVPFSLSRLGEAVSMKLPVKGCCQEVIYHHPDIRKIPLLHCWPKDEGPSIPSSIVMTLDPETRTQSVTTYNLRVFDQKTVGIQWNGHQPEYALYELYKKRKEKMPISIVIGGDPATLYAATASLPKEIDKMMLAGYLRKSPVKIVKSVTNDIYVPADAEFILEGYIDVNEPLCRVEKSAAHTGVYSEDEAYLVVHLTCMTCKKEPIYPAMIIGKSLEEIQHIRKATERALLPVIKKISPEIVDMDFPVEGAFHGCVIVSIKKHYLGQAKKVMNMIWGMEPMMCSKVIIIVDETIKPNDYEAVATSILECVTPKEDILFTPGPLDYLDYASSMKGYGYRLGIDATSPIFAEEGIQKWHDIEQLSKENFFVNEALDGMIREMAVINEGIFKGYTIASIRKSEPQDINRVCQFYWDQENMESKCFIIVDENVDIHNPSAVSWRLFGNIDVQRDVLRIADEKGQVKVIIDATKKGLEEGHYRNWPEELTMSQEVNDHVTSKWEAYGIN